MGNFHGGILAAILFTALSASGQEVRPLEKRDAWTFGDKSAWEWNGEGAGTELILKKPSDFKPKVRSPFNLAWFEGGEWESFTLTAEVRLGVFDKGNNDVCIAFGKSSDTKFYYAHLGEKADAVHLQLHLVNDADRKAITTTGAKTLPWKPETWHRVKLVRNAGMGSIKVFFDDVEVLAAEDKTLGKGKIGLGSFDDLGAFRNVVVSPNP
jgi:hypothetical protein